MSESQADPIDVSQFKNGDDVHFDYTVNSNDSTINTTNAHKKRKKKKSKNKSKSSPNVEVTLNDPDVEYPTSRVIKQAPNGDVIIESLDEPSEAHAKSLSANIWDNSTLEEQENLKEFWESLDETQKMKLVKIDKKSIMDIFKNEAKTTGTQNGHQNNGNVQGGQGHSMPGGNGNISNGSSNSNGACTCTYCGRRNNFIEDELENIYDNHFDDIIDFIHEVRDINDINALPGLLFGGFHMLEEEHRLQKRQQRYKYEHDKVNQVKPVPISQSEDGNINQASQKEEDEYMHDVQHDQNREESEDGSVHSHSHSHIHNYSHNNIHNNNHNHNHNHNHDNSHNHNHSHSHFHYNQIEELNDDEELAQQPSISKSVDDIPTSDQLLETKEQKVFHKLLDPKLFEALENLDFEKIKSTPDNHQQNILEKAGSLRDIIRDLHKADKVELEKGMTFLQNMGKILSGDVNNNIDQNKRSAQLSQGLSNFAEDLLKNDGNSFIDMMESLSESRTAREDLLKEKFDSEPSAAWIDEDDKAKITNTEMSLPRPDLRQVQTLEENLKEEYDEEEDEEEEEEDGEEDDDEDLEDEGFEEEDGEVSDTESEISEEEKMQEIRRLFLIQVIKLFQERLKNAYKEKLSQDRTKMLIEELEAEENAKREKEMKKLKQKEKAKEKKRLQQLAKEEERRKREEEQKAKEEELKQKQEALKAEQKRKKEEAKQKREEEKRKRIEELKRKELEHQKKLEAQRKKEEESKKLKEERKKKAEDERKQREEERRQKELQKKLAEEKLAKAMVTKESEGVQEENKISQGLENPQIDPTLGVHVPASKPDAVLQQSKEPRVVSPKKNHILDQLYHAKPRSLSNSTGSTPTINHVAPGYKMNELPSNLLPSVLLPSTNNILPNSASNNQQASSPWSSQQAFSNNSQSSVYQPQFTSHTFSPFNSTFNQNNFPNNASENVNSNPLSTAGFNEPFPTNTQPPSVWNPAATSRNNSIWNNSPSVSTNPNLWSNPTAPSSVGGVGVATPNPPINSTANIDSDLVQTAAYQAFQFLQSSNQLEFGVAPSLILFQTAKTILANQSLTLNQFLTCCRNTGSFSGYIFDFIYDDFGTVTHINVSPANITSQPLQRNLSTQNMNNIGIGNVPSGTESLLNSLGDLGNNLNAFSNASRGLWN